MKFLALMLFVLVNMTNVYAQQQTKNATLDIYSPMVSDYVKASMKRRGYKTLIELNSNTFNIFHISVPLVGYSTDPRDSKAFDFGYTYMEHYKNKFYFATSFNNSFRWADKEFVYTFGGSFALGGTYFDNRNETLTGVLIGSDIELGIGTGFLINTITPYNHISTTFNTKIVYTSTASVGLFIEMQLGYYYYLQQTNPDNTGFPERHEFVIKPKIGIVF